MKKLLLVVAILSIVGYANAYTFSIDEDAARYNGQIESSVTNTPDPVVQTQPGDPDPNMMTLCNKQLQLEPASGGGGFFKLQDGPQQIPTDIQCSVGSKDITVYSDTGNEYYPDQLYIDPFNMESFYGKYLYLNGEADPAKIHDFYLSNDNWGEDHTRPDPEDVYPDSDSAWVMVNEKDIAKKDDSAAYEASLGSRIESSDGDLTGLIDDVPSAGDHSPGNTLVTSTGGNNGVCEEGPCAMINKIDFGDTDANKDIEYNDVEIGSFTFFPESVTSAHTSFDGGEYRPEGEIMVGRKPEHANGGPDSSGPYFFICTAGATMNNGYEQVDRVINVSDGSSEDLYQCQPGQREWEPVNSCNDGLDNDDDGQIDSTNSEYQSNGGGQEADESSCGATNANSEYTETGSNSCKQGVKYETIYGPYGGVYERLVAQYEKDNGDCSTEGTIELDDEIVYDQWEDTTNFEPQSYTCENDDDVINPAPCRIAEEDDPNIYGVYDNEYDEVGVVEYYPEKAYFNSGTMMQKLNNGEVVETGFVGDEGWKPKYESLFESKDKYADSTVIVGGENNLFKYGTWKDRIRSPEVEDAYNNTANTFDNHVKAWGIANAGVTNSNVSSASTTFSGGYYGLCEEQKAWQDTGDDGWRCSGEIEWDQAIHLPQFEGPDEDYRMDVGLIVMGYNNQQDWDDYVGYPDSKDRTLGFDSSDRIGSDGPRKGWMSYPLATQEADYRNQDTLDYMNATCWAGSPSDKPDSSIENGNNEGSRYLKWTNVPVLEGVPYGVTGRLDSSSDTDFNLANFNGYTCNWEYQTQDSGAVNVSGQVRELHSMSSESGTSNLSIADWSAVSSIDPEFARPPSPPVSFEEGIAASRSMAEAMGWLETPQTIFENIGDSVIPEGNPSGSTSFDVLGYEGDGSNVRIVTDDTYTPFYGDELDDESCSALNEYDHPYSSFSGIPVYSDIDHVYSAAPPSASWGANSDGEEPVWNCPEWYNEGPGIGGDPVNVPTVIDFIGQDGERPPSVEFGEEGNPIANFMAAYNDPGNGMLKLEYDNYQELQDSLDAWENRAN